MKVKDIINVCSGKLLFGDLEEEVNNFSKDTRTINKNDVYVGIKGDNFDGNEFYLDAFDKGANVCILDNDKIDYKNIDGKTIILVDNSIKAIQKLAIYKRSLYDIPVIAVTGSVGKTSTRNIIYTVLSQKYNVLKTEGNYNNDIGVPLTILGLNNQNLMIIEMGMNHLGEIKLLSEIAKPTHAVITNVGTAHIGNLGSRENILKAKLEIIEGLCKDGKLYINNDNDMLHSHLDEIKEKVDVVTIGIDNTSDYMATNIKEDAFESNFKINDFDYKINVGGRAFIYNSLMAYALGKEFNLTNEEIKKGINNVKLEKNRLEKIIGTRGETIINDTYNASFDSIKNAIDLLSKSNSKRKILLLGDILELGEYSEDIHRNIGKEILNHKFDEIILVGNDVKYIKEELINNSYNANIYLYKKESETYELLDNLLNKDDIILLKGSHGINLVNIVRHLTQK